MQYTGDGVAFSFFGIDVRWYGLIIVTGIVLAVYLAQREANRRGMGDSIIYDLSLIILPAAIVGTRLWYVIFEWERYQGDLMKILNLRESGLAIQGGIIGALIAGYIYSKKKNYSFLRLADILFPVVALAQSIGRWGNFTNNEAFGTPTDLPWALQIDGVGVHPTFLYESIGTFSIFLILLWLTRKKLTTDGQVSMLYLILYGVVRFFVEGMRTDSLWVGPFRTAQLIALIGIIIGVVGLYILSKRPALAHVPGVNPEDTLAEENKRNRKKKAKKTK